MNIDAQASNANEQAAFALLVQYAKQNATDTPPKNPNEFDIYCDNHYNIHMFINGEWKNVGLNVTFL